MLKKARGITTLLLCVGTLLGCSTLTETRPSQQMLNMEVAIRAAKEVSADTLAPELFRLSNETALIARREYRVKNFENARMAADKARVYAEQAEFESIRNGGKRETLPQDPLADPSQPSSP